MTVKSVIFHTENGKAVSAFPQIRVQNAITITYTLETQQCLGEIVFSHLLPDGNQVIEIKSIKNLTWEMNSKDRIHGIGTFFIKKMVELSKNSSCYIHLHSLRNAVFFYWKMGFRPDPHYDHYFLHLYPADQLEERMREKYTKIKRDEASNCWEEEVKMYLPEFMVRKWRELLTIDRVLQIVLKAEQRPIQRIEEMVWRDSFEA